jgi:hypothetical protein
MVNPFSIAIVELNGKDNTRTKKILKGELLSKNSKPANTARETSIKLTRRNTFMAKAQYSTNANMRATMNNSFRLLLSICCISQLSPSMKAEAVFCVSLRSIFGGVPK